MKDVHDESHERERHGQSCYKRPVMGRDQKRDQVREDRCDKKRCYVKRDKGRDQRRD